MIEEKNIALTATEFKQNLGKHLEYVCENKSDVVITKNGIKIARLTPYISDIEQYYLVKENAVDYSYGGKRVTYEEFQAISRKSTKRMELIDGEIYLLASPNFWHQEILGFLYIQFKQFLKGKKCRVSIAPFDINFYKPEVKDPDVLQPDLFVICDSEEKLNLNGRYFGTPTLVIEIMSTSTRSKDMVKKLNTYMISGVKEYWVVDPKHQLVMIYAFNNEREVLELQTYKKEDTIKSKHFFGLEISFDEIFNELPESESIDLDDFQD